MYSNRYILIYLETLEKHMRKFMQTVGDKVWRELRKEAQTRDVSIQALIRVDIIPFWLKSRK